MVSIIVVGFLKILLGSGAIAFFVRLDFFTKMLRKWSPNTKIATALIPVSLTSPATSILSRV